MTGCRVVRVVICYRVQIEVYIESRYEEESVLMNEVGAMMTNRGCVNGGCVIGLCRGVYLIRRMQWYPIPASPIVKDRKRISKPHQIDILKQYINFQS